MKMIEAFKEELNKFIKEIQENIIKQVKEMNETVEDLKMEIEAIKET
jgi:archaellum component FlaC